MNFLKKTLLGLAVSMIGAIAMSQPAAAMTITVTGMKVSVNPTIATIHSPTASLNVKAGEFTVTDGSTSFLAWCIDISQATNFNQVVNDYTVGSAAAFGQGKANALARLATEALSQVGDSETSGAFQLAAWEIVNETEGTYNLTAGTFYVDNVSDGSRAKAQIWLNNLPTVSTYSVGLLMSASRQDLAVFEKLQAVPPTSVPEPASIALLGLGLSALAVSRRRKAASKTA